MQKATEGIVTISGETLLELPGFLTDEDEVILSDSKKMGDWKKVKVKFEPSALAFFVEQNKSDIEKICDVSIM